MRVNISDAKQRLSKLVDSATKGTEVVILQNGKPVAKLVPVRSRFRDDLLRAGAALVAVGEDHAIQTSKVLLDHGDPFDRILVATAMVEGLQLLTTDAHLLDATDANASLPIVPL
jgi:prevent-host-death family protein